MKRGITVAGNIMVDTIKQVDAYPRPGNLAAIREMDRSVGGVLGNTIVDLAILDPALRLNALGCVGDDENGEYCRRHLARHGIRTDGLRTLTGCATSFTDVILDLGTRQRTFFTYGGANDRFDDGCIDFGMLDADIFHLGYALLLKAMDAPDPEWGTVMSRTLARVRALGIKTSIDIVSEESTRTATVVGPCLPHCDYLIINEVEGAALTGIPARDADGVLLPGNMRRILSRLLELGVRELAVLHCPQGGFAMEATGGWHVLESCLLPAGTIVGTLGAGDAYCAGMLYGLHSGWSIADTMEFAEATAVACLQGSGGTTTMRDRDGIFALMKQLREWRTPSEDFANL